MDNPITQEEHNNPKDYGLTDKEAKKMRADFIKARIADFHHRLYAAKLTQDDRNAMELRILRNRIKILREHAATRQKQFLKRDSVSDNHASFITATWQESLEEIEALERRIRFIKLPLIDRSSRGYNIEAIKRIPIDSLVSVNAAGFFKIRDEKTPSCKYYKNENRWHDFGSDTGGDIIDLWRAINKCETSEALKALSKIAC
jgi:hypothetical protein